MLRYLLPQMFNTGQSGPGQQIGYGGGTGQPVYGQMGGYTGGGGSYNESAPYNPGTQLGQGAIYGGNVGGGMYGGGGGSYNESAPYNNLGASLGQGGIYGGAGGYTGGGGSYNESAPYNPGMLGRGALYGGNVGGGMYGGGGGSYNESAPYKPGVLGRSPAPTVLGRGPVQGKPVYTGGPPPKPAARLPVKRPVAKPVPMRMT
jgi:hypothetical protein